MAQFGESVIGIAMLVVAALLLLIGLFWLRAVVKIRY